MAYTVDYTDGTKTAITVNDGTINTDTSLGLVGKNYYGYGEVIAENFLHLLENFASDTAPTNAKRREGQLWFDTSASNKELKYFDGVDWRSIGGGSELETILDNSSVGKEVIFLRANSTLIAVISPHDQFTVHPTQAAGSPTETVHTAFQSSGTAVINKGINLVTNTTGDAFKLHGIATQAEYADLAELYSSDSEYEPGTVLMIGGEAEVTQTTEAFSPEVFGIVSTNPAYLMNSAMEGLTVAVALEGRVPCKVIGPVRKGQRLVSSEEPGVARAVSDYEKQEALDWYRIVGRALADKDSEGIELMEVVVGIK